MKSKNTRLYVKATKQTVLTNKGIKGIHLSFDVKCEKKDFESYVRRSAKLLTDCNLEKVKSFSVRFEILD